MMFLSCSRLILGSWSFFCSGFFAYNKIILSIAWEEWMTSATTSLILVLIRQKPTMLWELLFVSPERFVVTNGRVRKTVQLWCEIHTHSNVRKDSVLPFKTYRVMTEDNSRRRKLI